MVEHLVCNQVVVGSNPVASTTGARDGRKREFNRSEAAREGRSAAVIFENEVGSRVSSSRDRTKERGQATKGIWWMPRRSGPMKVVA